MQARDMGYIIIEFRLLQGLPILFGTVGKYYRDVEYQHDFRSFEDDYLHAYTCRYIGLRLPSTIYFMDMDMLS